MSKDTEQLAELIKKAKGYDRSIREYAAASNVNASTISRMIAGSYTPGFKILKKLVSEAAAPRGSITYEDLLVAAGYKIYTLQEKNGTRQQEEFADDTAIDVMDYGYTDSEEKSHHIENHQRKHGKVSQKQMEQMRFDSQCRQMYSLATGMIFKALAQKRILCMVETMNESEDVGTNSQVVIELIDQKIKRWTFEIWNYNSYVLGVSTEIYIQQVLMSLFLRPTSPDEKVSIVFDDLRLYQKMVELKGKLPYRGNLSVILVESSGMKFYSEEQITFYEEEPDEESVIRLVD